VSKTKPPAQPPVITVTKALPVAPATNQTDPRRILRLLVLTLATLAAVLFSLSRLDSLGKPQPPRFLTADESAAREKVVDELSKQSGQFRGWSVLVIGGIIALAATTKTHRTRFAPWYFIPLAPAATLILFSLHSAWELDKKANYLKATQEWYAYLGVAEIMQVQADLFLDGIVCAAVFAGFFLFGIVYGNVEHMEGGKA